MAAGYYWRKLTSAQTSVYTQSSPRCCPLLRNLNRRGGNASFILSSERRGTSHRIKPLDIWFSLLSVSSSISSEDLDLARRKVRGGVGKSLANWRGEWGFCGA